MSQESPNSQIPLSPKRKPRGNSFPAAVKTQTIRLLRRTIGVLEGAIEQLEAETTTTSQARWWESLQDGWSFVLERIRSLLPANLSEKLSNSALTGILAGITALVVLTASNLLSSKPPTEVAVALSPQIEQSPTVTTTPSVEPEVPAVKTTPSPESEIPVVATTPSVEPEVPAVAMTPSVEPTPAVSPTSEPEADLFIPSELSTPAAPQPVNEAIAPSSETMPTLVAQLTPEEILVATIQKQVEEISDRLADGLIQSIKPNFEGSNLIVTLADDWYDLQSSQQDKLAAEMLERSRELDFSRLEAIDPKGNIVARSPIVGNNMVIFRRQNSLGDR